MKEIRPEKRCVMNKIFISKMLKAKQLELETVSELLPANVQGHMNVIGRELKAMAEEAVLSACTKAYREESDMHSNKSMTKTSENKTVNKINIE